MIKLQEVSLRNKLAFITSIISFILLFPGIFLPMLTISSKAQIEVNISEEAQEVKIINVKRSILTTVKTLWYEKFYFVSTMIFLFSVIVPLVKGVLLTYIYFNKDSSIRKRIYNFIKSIGKWSMCDVFIVAIFLAYLSTGSYGSEQQDITLMGYTLANILPVTEVKLHTGFWCFLSYCLLSLISLQLYEPY